MDNKLCRTAISTMKCIAEYRQVEFTTACISNAYPLDANVRPSLLRQPIDISSS